MGKERRAQQREFDYNAEQAQLNRDFQSQEAQLAREWQTSERVAEQDYQNPVHQMQMIKEAGINPSVYFGGSSSFASSSPSAPSAPVPVGSSAHSGSQIVSNIPQLMSSVSDMIKALGGYKADTAQSREIRTLLEGKLEGLVLDNVQKGLVNDSINLENSINRVTKDPRILSATAALVNQYADIFLKFAQGDKNVSETALNYSQQVLNDALSNLRGQEAALVKLEIANYLPKLKSYLNLQKSEAAKNYAQAAESDAGAREKRASAESIEFFNSIRQQPDVKDSLIKQLRLAGEAAERANEMSKEQANMLRAQIAQLEKATSNYEIQMWSQIINQTINTAANAVGEFTKFGLTKKFLDSSKSDNPPMEYWPGTTTRGQQW